MTGQPSPSTELIHATTVAIGARAVLIVGPSGSGKSDLALRLIDRGAMLVSDDYTLVEVSDGGLLASAPATIVGQMEVRGIGIVTLPHRQRVPIALAVRIGAPDRLPDAATRSIAGVAVREVVLDALEPSASIKVELALGRCPGSKP